MIRSMLAASLLLALLPLAALAAPFTGPTVVQFEQTFDAGGDTSGWFGWNGSFADASAPWLNQVASGGGSLGVASAGGSSGHAEIGLSDSPFQSVYTGFGGYSSSWPGFIRQSLDVYIDPSAGNVGDGWALDNAVNNSAGAWLEAGGVGAEKTGASTWSVSADGDGAGYQGGGIAIGVAGWYTIVSEWAPSADMLNVDRNTYIYDASGSLLYGNENLAQVSLSDIGGWRYGWTLPAAGSGPLTLAIDNSRLEILAEAVPEPVSLSLAGMGLALLAFAGRRRV